VFNLVGALKTLLRAASRIEHFEFVALGSPQNKEMDWHPIFGSIRFREILEIALLLLRFRETGPSQSWPRSGRQSICLCCSEPFVLIPLDATVLSAKKSYSV
jgi:hypothetical protein